MRRLIRTTLSLAVLAALAAVTAGAVAAGNYAETSIVDGADTPPTAGEERELRLLLLQHGITPVDHGSVELTAWLPGTEGAGIADVLLGDTPFGGTTPYTWPATPGDAALTEVLDFAVADRHHVQAFAQYLRVAQHAIEPLHVARVADVHR